MPNPVCVTWVQGERSMPELTEIIQGCSDAWAEGTDCLTAESRIKRQHGDKCLQPLSPGIIESLRLDKTLKITEFNHKHNTASPPLQGWTWAQGFRGSRHMVKICRPRQQQLFIYWHHSLWIMIALKAMLMELCMCWQLHCMQNCVVLGFHFQMWKHSVCRSNGRLTPRAA